MNLPNVEAYSKAIPHATSDGEKSGPTVKSGAFLTYAKTEDAD